MCVCVCALFRSKFTISSRRYARAPPARPVAWKNRARSKTRPLPETRIMTDRFLRVSRSPSNRAMQLRRTDGSSSHTSSARSGGCTRRARSLRGPRALPRRGEKKEEGTTAAKRSRNREYPLRGESTAFRSNYGAEWPLSIGTPFRTHAPVVTPACDLAVGRKLHADPSHSAPSRP